MINLIIIIRLERFYTRTPLSLISHLTLDGQRMASYIARQLSNFPNQNVDGFRAEQIPDRTAAADRNYRTHDIPVRDDDGDDNNRPRTQSTTRCVRATVRACSNKQ